jgi:hypothetical protein
MVAVFRTRGGQRDDNFLAVHIDHVLAGLIAQVLGDMLWLLSRVKVPNGGTGKPMTKARPYVPMCVRLWPDACNRVRSVLGDSGEAAELMEATVLPGANSNVAQFVWDRC